jgi:hypothetical protein
LKRGKFKYSVSEAEVSSFIEANACVREFLNRYEENGVTYTEKAFGLVRFFQDSKSESIVNILKKERVFNVL